MDNTKSILLQQIKESLNKLLRRVQKEIPAYGDFATISEDFTNSNSQLYCGDVSMAIKHLLRDCNPSATQCCFDLIVKTPSAKSICSCYIFCGTKAELLEHLANEAFCDDLQQKITEMANELRTDKFA